MTKEQGSDEQPAGGAVPAVPPPDDPLRRHQQDADVHDQDAARRRLEAILHTRAMPDGNDEPEGDDGS